VASRIRRVEYFYTTVRDQPGEAYKLLHLLTELGINQLAFSAVPTGLMRTQLTIFPEEPQKLTIEAKRAKLDLDGPYPALLVQADDELGALADIHRRLFEAGVNVYASSGVADGRGSYGYVIYVRPEEFETAAQSLNV
jgi:hypothetical protein